MAIVAPDQVDLGRDALLVERTQAGDLAAFDDLYRRYFPRLRRFCLRYLDDPADAEEVAQEALARAYRSIASLGGDRRFYPWLSVIAKRLCIDHYRRTSRIELFAEVEPDGVEPTPDQHIIDLADHQILGQALDRLAPRHREVLERREVDGWSYQRIADEYGVSLGTVEQLLLRARKSLRRTFLELDGDSVPAAAALPVFGGLLRRWTSFWTSVQAKVGQAQPILSSVGGGIAGLAIVVGAAGVGGGGSLPHAGAGPAGLVPARSVAHTVSHAVASATGGASAGGVGRIHGNGGSKVAPPLSPHNQISASPHVLVGSDDGGGDKTGPELPVTVNPTQPLRDGATVVGDLMREIAP